MRHPNMVFRLSYRKLINLAWRYRIRTLLAIAAFLIVIYLYLDTCSVISSDACMHLQYTKAFAYTADRIPNAVSTFLRVAKRLQCPLIVLDVDWLFCMEHDSTACQTLSSKRRYMFGTRSSLLVNNAKAHLMLKEWNITSNSRRIVARSEEVHIIIVVLSMRGNYWLLPAVPEYDIPTMAFRELNTRVLHSGFDFYVEYPFPLKSFLSNVGRAEFIQCRSDIALKLRIEHRELYANGSKIPSSMIESVAYFRNLLEGFKATPILFGGTLLGWYRECGIIPHTTDMDLAIFASSFTWNIVEALKIDHILKLYWVLGKPSDSLELSVYANGTKIDLFCIYEESGRSWVGGMIPYKKTKLQWSYPAISRLCTADLLGELFHVPCNVVEVLIADYGKHWYQVHHDSNFIWYKSHKNVKVVGQYSEKEWPNVYQKF